MHPHGIENILNAFPNLRIFYYFETLYSYTQV